MTPPPLSAPLDRRAAIQWMLTATAGLTLPGTAPAQVKATNSAKPAPLPPITAKGYGPDPDIVKIYNPGDVWPLTFTNTQRRTATALCDVILPADDTSPAASTVGVPAFIDEWVSSPYPEQAPDRPLILEGLTWIEAESQRRFKTPFPDLQPAQQTAICDDIASAKPKPEHKKPAAFFKRYRDLTAGGYYTTPEGMKDIGYRGNVTSATFDGPPLEALKHVGLA